MHVHQESVLRFSCTWIKALCYQHILPKGVAVLMNLTTCLPTPKNISEQTHAQTPPFTFPPFPPFSTLSHSMSHMCGWFCVAGLWRRSASDGWGTRYPRYHAQSPRWAQPNAYLLQPSFSGYLDLSALFPSLPPSTLHLFLLSLFSFPLLFPFSCPVTWPLIIPK